MTRISPQSNINLPAKDHWFNVSLSHILLAGLQTVAELPQKDARLQIAACDFYIPDPTHAAGF